MHNKDKCRKCKYHGYFSGKPVNASDAYMGRIIMCDYSSISQQSCLYDDNGFTVDRRGNDPKHCKLFEAGQRERYRNFNHTPNT